MAAAAQGSLRYRVSGFAARNAQVHSAGPGIAHGVRLRNQRGIVEHAQQAALHARLVEGLEDPHGVAATAGDFEGGRGVAAGVADEPATDAGEAGVLQAEAGAVARFRTARPRPSLFEPQVTPVSITWGVLRAEQHALDQAESDSLSRESR